MDEAETEGVNDTGVILMAAKPPEDLLLCHAVTTELREKQVLRSLRSHQDDGGYQSTWRIRQ